MKLRRILSRLALALALTPAVARANGAFPDSLQILLPADDPNKIVLATNFGLVFSYDAGTTWQWTCEHDASLRAILYQLSPPPVSSILAVGFGLVRTLDDGCTWRAAEGRIANGYLYDLFIDPTDAQRVLAIADPNDETPTRTHVFESHDNGASFPDSLYAAEAGTDLSGVESARAEPDTVYVTYISSLSGKLRSGVLVLRDKGQTVTKFDLTDSLGGDPLRIAAVDRTNPRKLFLRAIGSTNDRIAISEDGGATTRVAVDLLGSLTAFIQRDDGTLFVAGREREGGVLFVSHDGGVTFTRMASAPRFRALAARGNRLYAAADEALDGFALGSSDDDGVTWKPAMSFIDIKGVKMCAGTDLQATCASTCKQLQWLQVIRPAVCGSSPADAAVQDGPPPPVGAELPGNTSSSGCHCSLSRDARPGPLPFLLAILALGSRRALRSRRDRQ